MTNKTYNLLGVYTCKIELARIDFTTILQECAVLPIICAIQCTTFNVMLNVHVGCKKNRSPVEVSSFELKEEYISSNS